MRTDNDLEAGQVRRGGPAVQEGKVLEYVVDGDNIVGERQGRPGVDSIEMTGRTNLAIHAYHNKQDACQELVDSCPIPLAKPLLILSTAPTGDYELSTSQTPPDDRRPRTGTNGKLNVGSGPGF